MFVLVSRELWGQKGEGSKIIYVACLIVCLWDGLYHFIRGGVYCHHGASVVVCVRAAADEMCVV